VVEKAKIDSRSVFGKGREVPPFSITCAQWLAPPCQIWRARGETMTIHLVLPSEKAQRLDW